MFDAIGTLFIFFMALPVAVLGAVIAWMVLFNLLKAFCLAVYWTVCGAWRFVILPAMLCFIAVIGSPFFVIFILAPWCLRRLFRTKLAAEDPLWHPLR